MAFVGWASGIFVAGSVAMLLICRHVTGGRVIYLIDDAAIHLSVARNLLAHRTWGVQPGVYESVSSSPLWDFLLAGAMATTKARDVLPWALNVASGLWLIWAIGSRQHVLRPSRKAALSVAATAGLITVALFMPTLTMVGMEHLLHAAMVVQLVAWIHDRARGRATNVPAWAPYLLAFLAVLTRFETMWVVAGIGVGYLVDGWVTAEVLPDSAAGAAGRRPVLVARLPTVAGLGLATAVPVVAYASINRAMGQGFLPNSVLAKGAIPGSAVTRGPRQFLYHLSFDPLVAVLLIAAIVYLAVATTTGRARSIVPAVTVVVAVVVHSAVAQYGIWERYQAYLIALGFYFVFSAAGEFVADRSKVVAALTLAALLVTPMKWDLLIQTPHGADTVYSQRYQGALFAERYYDGRSIATGELGYNSLLHRGPVTDVLGLGDYQVLRRRAAGTDDQAFYAGLAQRHDVQIVLVYSGAIGARTPSAWFLVAEWWQHGSAPSNPDEPYQFWATSAEAATELRTDLVKNTVRLPPHVTEYLNTCLGAELDGAGNAQGGGQPDGGCLAKSSP